MEVNKTHFHLLKEEMKDPNKSCTCAALTGGAREELGLWHCSGPTRRPL